MPSRLAFWPREHGAYAQLAAPLVAALVLAHGGASVLLALAATLAFLAHEALLVVLGHRGVRARARGGRRAWIWLGLNGGVALAAGVLGLALAPSLAREVAALVAIPTAVLLVLAVRKAEHTPAGEVVAAISLSGASSPVIAAGGASFETVMLTWLAWAAGFSCTVAAVHRVLRRRSKVTGGRLADAVPAVGLAGTACVIAVAAEPLLVAAVPLALASAWIVARPPPVTQLRAIGMGLAVATTASTAASVLLWAGPT
jgi:hypothetical protein